MTFRDSERLPPAEAVWRSLATENVLTRAQARAFVRCLQSAWQVRTISWSDRESENQLKDAMRLLHAARVFASVEGSTSLRAVACYRRAGELLEWLARPNDKLRRFVPIELVAAGAYQMGGLPAMASGLLERVTSEHEGVRLYSSFFQGDFDSVLEHTSRFWDKNPDLIGVRGTAGGGTAAQGDGDGTGLERVVTVELVRCLGLVADSLRRGEVARLTAGMAKLQALDDLSVRVLGYDAALIIGLLSTVAQRFAEASIYGPMRQLAEMRPEREERLLRYAREQFSRGRGILWDSQLRGIDRLLHTSSFALCTPTGSGKTMVANLALIKELLLREWEGDVAPLALYLVPSRALAGEVEEKLRLELSGDVLVTGLYGGVDWGLTDVWLSTERPVVLVATVEKADALMRYLGGMLLSRLALLVIDEAHQVVVDTSEATAISLSDHSNRSIRLEGLVARVLAARPGVSRIALTAVAGGASGPVASWMEGRSDAEAVGGKHRPTRQVIGALETSPGSSGRILLEVLNGRPLFLRGEEEPVYLQLRFDPMPRLPATWRNSLNRFNCLSVLWTALHLSREDSRVLISVVQEPEQTMRWFTAALSRPDWEGAIPFAVPDGPRGARFSEARAACVDYCGAQSYEVFLLDRGIATSHGQMPQRLRRLMVEMVDLKVCPITVATATLTEGVNLPFDFIFLTSLKRLSWDPDRERQVVSPLSTAEFSNLAGRAGRPGVGRSVEGMTLVALPIRASTTAPAAQAEQDRQRRMWQADYTSLVQRICSTDVEAQAVQSPLALLLDQIAQRAIQFLSIAPDEYLNWLERTAPGEVSPEAGTGATDAHARLADLIDELDGVLLSAMAQVEHGGDEPISVVQAEVVLRDVWARTFAAVSAAHEDRLTSAFIRRGTGILRFVYSDRAERMRLYQYGFSPAVGRRFEAVAEPIRRLLRGASDYGSMDVAARVAVFAEIGNLLGADNGYGFKIRSTVQDQTLLSSWDTVLAWWMFVPDATAPDASELRSWQRFVTENLEFRLGVAVGAVVAQSWADGFESKGLAPTLADWRKTTGLPWFAFWLRELLRWGTHDPFVAFCLVHGLARTRESAAQRRGEFERWLAGQVDDVVAEDLIDPERFLQWLTSLPRRDGPNVVQESLRANLTGTDGRRGRYPVVPLRRGNGVRWLDAAGFELAASDQGVPSVVNWYASDFELDTLAAEPSVSWVPRRAG